MTIMDVDGDVEHKLNDISSITYEIKLSYSF